MSNTFNKVVSIILQVCLYAILFRLVDYYEFKGSTGCLVGLIGYRPIKYLCEYINISLGVDV